MASVTALNIHPTAIDQVCVQRVADVMYQFGLSHSRFNVTPVIGPLTRPRGTGRGDQPAIRDITGDPALLAPR